MAKVKGPLFSIEARGRIGKVLIYRKGGIVTRYFIPRDPKTAAQLAQREAFLEFVMSGLTKEEADLLYAAIAHLHDDRYLQLTDRWVDGGEVYLSGSYVVVTPTHIASIVYEDIGLTVTLPEAGTYELWLTARGALKTNGGATRQWLQCRLYDSTADEAIAQSELMVAFAVAGITDERQSQASIACRVTVTEETDIDVQGAAVYQGTVPTWTTKNIQGDAYGWTKLAWLRVG